MAELYTLTPEEVLRVHEILVADFAVDNDPISPAGVRSLALLESAVGRQHAGWGQALKYPEPVGNAATLLFGICCDHPFHNGNKRTALVALLVHLDRNRLCLHRTSQKELYEMLTAVAAHSIQSKGLRKGSKRTADEEVAAIVEWLRPRVENLKRGERQVSYRRLRQILRNFDYELEGPHDNMIGVWRLETKSVGVFRRRTETTKKRIGTIGYKDEGTEVSLKELKSIRRLCRLTEEDGVDSAAFYSEEAVIDAFVNRYRTVLRRLART